jgi:hypothetical protein
MIGNLPEGLQLLQDLNQVGQFLQKLINDVDSKLKKLKKIQIEH